MARMIAVPRSKAAQAKDDLGAWDFVPECSRSVKARLSRKKYDRVAFKRKQVHFPAKAWNAFLRAKKKAERKDPRHRLYPYEFAAEQAEK